MKDFVEKETLRILQDWGYYDMRYIVPTRIYVIQKTYDSAYPNATPFENSHPELVVFRNGTYNIMTDKMTSNNPNNYILNAHDYDLDMSGKATPLTDALLNGMIGENAIFLKQYIGYTFYRSYAPAQEMVFFKGKGGEGKSTLLNFIANDVIGNNNVSAVTPQDLAQDKFVLAELLGKTLNISADIKDDYLEDSSVLKRLTGGDSIIAQYKGIQGFKMVNYAKFIFSANILPRFKDTSEGFANRLVVIPFINGNQRVQDATFWKDHDMDKIKKEAPAFAYSCIREFRKIFDGRKASFTKPESLNKAKKEWVFDNDHIAEFINEATVFHFGDDRGEIASTVHSEYKAFCRENSYYAKSPQALRDFLEEKGIPKIRSRKGFNDGGSSNWRYQGLKLVVSYIIPLNFDE